LTAPIYPYNMVHMATKKPVKRGMSDDHKAALAEGRIQSRAVRDYLEALDAIKPKRGRPRTADSIKRRLDAVEEAVPEARAEERLLLIQERMDLVSELASVQAKTDLSEVEDAFVSIAADYGRRKGISYAAWREAGVPAAVLKRAGVGRGA
jgi:hypothetical protein